MTALTADRDTREAGSDLHYYPVAASVLIYAGSLVVLDSSGNAKPGVTGTGLICVGRAEAVADNSSGAAAAISVTVRGGTFPWVNGDTITKAHIGDTAYITDDQTVARVGTGKSTAGIITDVDSAGVWVQSGPGEVPGSLGLLAANNLSDVTTVITSFDNLSANGADVASATTIDLDAATGNCVDVTGTTTITAITLAEGKTRLVRFTGALTLTHGASLVLPGAANVTTVAGDWAIFQGDASSVVRCVVYQKYTITGTGSAVRATTPTLTTPVIGAATGTSVALTGAIKSSGASQGVGYATGAGGAVTQITNRSTGVTMSPNPCMSGTITTDTSSLAAEVSADFIVTNSGCAIGDVVVASIRSGSDGGNTAVTVTTVTAGTFTIKVSNNNAAGGTAETGAIIINFAIIKAVSA